MTHPIIEDLQWRHTVKKYNANKKIPQKDLEVLFESMRLSASSINSQPWRFVVIGSDLAKERMSKTFVNQFQMNKPHIHDCSHVILFAHNPHYTHENFEAVVDQSIEDKRTKPENKEATLAAFMFAKLNTDKNGSTANWTKAQTYLALGNTLHTLARLKIDSTPMEGIDINLVNEEFKEELAGYQCDVALAIGYQDPVGNYNASLPKSRLKSKSIFVQL